MTKRLYGGLKYQVQIRCIHVLYEDGYAGLVKDEGVELIHADEEKVDPDGNYDGYIVGLH